MVAAIDFCFVSKALTQLRKVLSHIPSSPLELAHRFSRISWVLGLLGDMTEAIIEWQVPHPGHSHRTTLSSTPTPPPRILRGRSSAPSNRDQMNYQKVCRTAFATN